jgi:hypothetical protein
MVYIRAASRILEDVQFIVIKTLTTSPSINVLKLAVVNEPSMTEMAIMPSK